MLGKRRKELIELQDKGKAYEHLIDELRDIRIAIILNGMPLLEASLMEMVQILRAVGEAELVKTHGNARVEGRIYSGIMEKRKAAAQTGAGT